MNFDPEKTIFLIDGSSFLYRAYYGIKPLHSPAGKPVQAVFSFCRMIKKLITMFHPQYLVLVWDSKGKTVRHEMFPAYKATRQAPPSDLFEQKEKIIEFADLIGLKQVAQTGVEADDLMYSIAQERALEKDLAVFVTSDKDMGQAISDHIVMFDPFKEQFIAKEAIEAQMGFPVERLSLYYALVGDASDNIPGVAGIGKKTAQEICVHFASLEDVYARIDNSAIPERIRKALIADKANAFLSRDLFLLQKIELNLAKKDLAFDETRWDKALPLFQELGFRSLVPSADSAQKLTIAQDKVGELKKYNFIAVTTLEQLNQLVAQLKEAKVFAVDTEGLGVLRPLQIEMIGISVCMQEGTAYYIPFGHQTIEQQLSRDQVISALKPLLEDEQYKKYLHHAKFDQLVFFTAGIQLRGVHFDTLVAAHLLAKDWQRIGLKSLSLQYFNENTPSYEDVVKHHGYKNFAQVPLELATTYSACDARQTWRLAHLMMPEIMAAQLDELYYTVELPLIPVLCAMEARGIILDVSVLTALGKKVDKELALLEEQIIGFRGDDTTPFNINSPRQIQTLLFDVLKLPVQRKNAKTGASTDQAVLSELAKIHPAPSLILRYRELFKLKSTYIEALPTYVNTRTGRLHTSYNQTLVATGRLSSSEPNLQNIPADVGGYGIEIRAAFKPEPGHVFLSADYSQIELRVLAHLSQDQNLLHAFLTNVDIHTQTASRLFEVPLALVTHEQRQLGKRINFSILYGLTPYGLSKDLDISLSDAKKYIDKYFEQYPQVRAWMDAVVAQTIEQGYVRTLWGRRRYVPGIYEKNKTLYEQARRVVINTPAQGTAAEIMKKGMLDLSVVLARDFAQAYMVLQIHDELLISVPAHQAHALAQTTKTILENVVAWTVPLVVSTQIGADWKEVTK